MRLALGVLAAAAGALAVMAKRGPSRDHRPPRDSVERPCEPERGGGPASVQQPPRPALHAADGGAVPGDTHHQREEREYWRRSLAASWVAAGAALVAVLFAAGAYNETRRQADTAQEALIAADRPWIKINKLSRVRIDVDDHVVWVSADVQVKNIGRSPAQHTYLKTTLLSDSSLTEQTAEAENLCRRSAASGYSVDERLVFPDDGHLLGNVTGLGMEAIQRKRDDRLRWEADVSRRNFGEDATVAENRMKERMALPLRVGFTLVGCVTYAVSARRVVGQTSFIYGLDRACGLGPLGICTFDMDPPAIYAGDDISIRDPIGGTFAR